VRYIKDHNDSISGLAVNRELNK